MNSSNNQASSNNNNDDTSTANTNSPATTHGYPGDYAALSDEDKAKWQHLYNNFDIIAVDNCPLHPHVTLCSCAVRVRGLKPYNRTKVDSFIRHWDQHLLITDYNAFDYDGTQERHHAFQAKNGQTPKHFARAFTQKMPHGSMFAPSGKLQDLVKAMIEFWVMRTTMWKIKYGSAEEVKEKWMPATYDMSVTVRMSFKGVKDLLTVKAGSPLPLIEVNLGPDGHQRVLWDCSDSTSSRLALR